MNPACNINLKLSPDLTNNQLTNKCDPNFKILAITIPTCGLVICNRVDQQESIETNSKPSEGVKEY